MNRRTRRPLVASLCVLLIPWTAWGQETPEPEDLSAEVSTKDAVATNESLVINVVVTGGAAPYAIVISDFSGVMGGFVDRTSDSGTGPGFEFVYTPPDDDIGAVQFEIQVTDNAGAEVTLTTTVPVVCPRIGLCTDFISNEELEALDALSEEQRLKDDEGQFINPTTGRRLVPQNLAVASVLSRLDIDSDGLADNTPDTDGDGLPNNWELGGIGSETDEENDRVVFYPAPSALVPGTPPTPIFTRLAVATAANDADTDGDGLSDFIEVFGLKFIDENGNGRLDSSEWADTNGDGLPSPGEYPLDNATRDDSGEPNNPYALLHDFDGFVFTDPTNPDTDGDSIPDGEDKEPLINPRSFGSTADFFIRFRLEEDPDIDKDGLGNGMDMGNDLVSTDGPGVLDFEAIDNPANVRELLDLFREDLLGENIVPESVVEDLFGIDWDGNGLWRTTDVRGWTMVINDPPSECPGDEGTLPPSQFFRLDPDDPTTSFYATQKLSDLLATFNDPEYRHYNGRGIGLGWQDLLRPPSKTQFIPDKRIWAILYAWRVPGFDIDGDGFIGVPNLSSTAPHARYCSAFGGGEANNASLGLVRDPATGLFTVLEAEVPVQVTENGDLVRNDDARPFDDRIPIAEDPEPVTPDIDGVIEVPFVADLFRRISCGGFGAATIVAIMLGLGLTKRYRRYR